MTKRGEQILTDMVEGEPQGEQREKQAQRERQRVLPSAAYLCRSSSPKCGGRLERFLRLVPGLLPAAGC